MKRHLLLGVLLAFLLSACGGDSTTPTTTSNGTTTTPTLDTAQTSALNTFVTSLTTLQFFSELIPLLDPSYLDIGQTV
ncbi:MAG: hypothetical protein O6934_02425, partial [SAR324 cluster bacterium]|nr:hypothetical protein [SAR324 cluster bacterium]